MSLPRADATARADPSALFIVAVVAAIHLAALHPVSLDLHALKKEPDEVQVVIEVAPNQPVASVQMPAQRSAPAVASEAARRAPQAASSSLVRPSVPAAQPPSPQPPLTESPAALPPPPRLGESTQVRAEPAVRANQASPAPDPRAADELTLPTTQASYEVGSAKNPRPPYPPAAYFARAEGQVLLKVRVQSDGRPGEIVMLQSSGSALLDKSALDTVARWELQPARKGGQSVEQWIEIPINFRLIQR